jgi:hypothetical protein
MTNSECEETEEGVYKAGEINTLVVCLSFCETANKSGNV